MLLLLDLNKYWKTKRSVKYQGIKNVLKGKKIWLYTSGKAFYTKIFCEWQTVMALGKKSHFPCLQIHSRNRRRLATDASIPVSQNENKNSLFTVKPEFLFLPSITLF